MKEVLILGHLVAGAEHFDRERVDRPDRRLIGASPAVCELLRDARVAHASLFEYVEDTEWEATHARIARALCELPAPAPDVRGTEWLDDWSHLIVDEARELFLWARVARRILDAERPTTVLLQEPIEARSSRRVLQLMGLAYELLGQRVETWRESRTP